MNMTIAQNEREKVSSLRKKLNELINKIERLYTSYETAKDPQIKKLELKIKDTYKELINAYKDLAKKTNNKQIWLELAELFSPRLNEHYYYLDPEEKEKEEHRKQLTEYIIRALEEHLKEFPDLLKAIGLLEPAELKFRSLNEDKTARDLARLYTPMGFVRAIRYVQCWLLRLYLITTPDDATAWIRLAQHYAELGELNNAENACEKALSLSPDDESIIARAIYVYGNLVNKSFGEMRSRFIKRQVELLEKRCQLNPTLVSPRLELAKIYSRYPLGESREMRLQKAINCLQEYLNEYPDSSWSAWKELAELYFWKGDKEMALKCYEKAFDIKHQINDQTSQ